MNHLMVDLETMGNGPYAPVISIGAVFFDPNKETLSRIGYFSKFEHLVKELCNREILLSQAQTLQDIQQHIETLGMSLSMAIDQFVESKS